MRVLIACDKFKGALDAKSVGEAIAAGLHDHEAEIEIDNCPLADGGEGTGELLAQAYDAEPCTKIVRGPLGKDREATWWWSKARRVAIIEMAQASGLALLSEAEYDPLTASSFGTGELIAAAMRENAAEIFVTVGGSATIDGGLGLLEALGWKFFRSDNSEIESPAGGGTLQQVAEVKSATPSTTPNVTVLADVQNPLCGLNGAALVYGPQKGATPQDCKSLDAGLRHFAKALADTLPHCENIDPDRSPHFGAAGGLPLALRAAFNANIQDGFSKIAEITDLPNRLSQCDLCITGEGRLDAQSLQGKVVGRVVDLARQHAKPIIIIAGSIAQNACTNAKMSQNTNVFKAVALHEADQKITPTVLGSTAADLRHAARALAPDLKAFTTKQRDQHL